MHTPTRIIARNGYALQPARPTGLGQIDPMNPVGRENLGKLATAVAAGGASAWALMNLSGQSKKNKTALTALGGGLAVVSILNLVDALL